MRHFTSQLPEHLWEVFEAMRPEASFGEAFGVHIGGEIITYTNLGVPYQDPQCPLKDSSWPLMVGIWGTLEGGWGV